MAKYLSQIQRELDEGYPTRKHFQQVADVIKAHPDHEKRKEMAQHHAAIFKAQNPRFDHARFYKAAGVNESIETDELDQELNDIYDGIVITEEEHDHHGVHDLVLHADNDSHLYHSSHVPIAKNLEKKHKKGIYDPEKAKKLWKYHADRAAQSYAHHHGDGRPWHKMFSPATRREAASHWEHHHRQEMEAGNFHESVEGNGDLIVEVSEHDLMNRPDLHAAREHFKKGIEHSRKHSDLVQAAHKKYGDGNGITISGIHRDHYPEHVKNELRHHARSVSHHNDLGMKARPKGVRHNTMIKLGRTVAKHHGPTGFYGFQPR